MGLVAAVIPLSPQEGKTKKNIERVQNRKALAHWPNCHRPGECRYFRRVVRGDNEVGRCATVVRMLAIRQASHVVRSYGRHIASRTGGIYRYAASETGSVANKYEWPETPGNDTCLTYMRHRCFAASVCDLKELNKVIFW